MPLVTVLEGEVDTAQPGVDLKYPSVTSCMTVTVVFDNGLMLGGHAVRVPTENQRSPAQILEELNHRIQAMREASPAKLWVLGDLGGWTPQFASADQDVSAAVGEDGQREQELGDYVTQQLGLDDNIEHTVAQALGDIQFAGGFDGDLTPEW